MRSVRQDADRCATYVYTYQAFNYRLNNHRLIDIINRHPAFWTGVMHAQLSAAFVALGRLYETQPEHTTLAMLLDSARLNVHLLERRSLESRKKLAGMSSEHAAAFVADAFEPTVNDFADIRKECAEARKIYHRAAKAIRDKVFAHIRRYLSLRSRRLFVRDANDGIAAKGRHPMDREALSGAAQRSVLRHFRNPPSRRE